MRPISVQVVVITGASSGIGRETALRFAERGASVVLAARNREALDEVAREVERAGGTALAVVCDVADFAQVKHVAEEAVDRFGRVDTWVNNAGVSVWGTFDQHTPEEFARVIEVNLLGEVHGCMAALEQMMPAGQGVIVNVGSVLSERAVPLQSAYCASKFGVRGFTESLRLELADRYPAIHVTLVEPSSMNTPLFGHARSRMGVMPRPIPPVYEPSTAAEAICFVAENPRRDVVVGGPGKLFGLLERLAPSLVDRYLVSGRRGFKQQMTDWPVRGEDNLMEPVGGPGTVTGDFGEGAKAVSVYTRYLDQYPGRKLTASLVALAASLLLVRRSAR